ncbi:MAG: 4-hydroxy-tetrahydrodipicolinate reductase [Sedimentisphaerales bacterium]|nr:4-hydroxy-tetrahydrodipicolinate reductase [Sedimentisphaerales bacterium]
MKPKLIVNGAAGRMGRRIIALAADSGQFDITGAVDLDSHPDVGKDAGLIAGIARIGIDLSGDFPKQADVMIDFSLPQATDKAVGFCAANNIALVLGTTGLGKNQLDIIDDASKKISVIQATNYSVGMNVLFSLVGKTAKMLGEDYDIEIIEAHHKFKKDSPSGTALTLAENIAKDTCKDFPACLVHGREGKDTLRKKGTIGMHAIRAGDIAGEHSVMFSAEGETLTFSHNAHNRDNFVRGSLRAAKWLVGKKPGRYSMKDVLGL